MHFTRDVVTHPCWDLSKSMSVKGVTGRVGVNSGVGVGIGVETSGVGVGVNIQETCRSWSWSWGWS